MALGSSVHPLSVELGPGILGNIFLGIQMKDLGVADVILNIKLLRDDDGPGFHGGGGSNSGFQNNQGHQNNHALSATTGCFITDDPVANNYFPDNDFFPDVHDLLDDMAGEDTDPKSSASAAAVPFTRVCVLLRKARRRRLLDGIKVSRLAPDSAEREMPELPEVEAARLALEEHCVGKRIVRCSAAEDTKVIDGVAPSRLEAALSFMSGIGNWMADEVLYQVIEKSVEVGADSNEFPENWIFHSREKKPGKAFVDGKKIDFVTVGGRTSAYVPELQMLDGADAAAANRSKKGRDKVEENVGKTSKKGQKAALKEGGKAAQKTDVDEEEEDDKPAKRRAKGAKALPKKVGNTRADDHEEGEDEDEESKPAKRGRKRPAKGPSKKEGCSSDDEDSAGKEETVVAAKRPQRKKRTERVTDMVAGLTACAPA
ncbi:hypothetical protein TRIUR3_15843 [Triticum urartu]|uniref:Uncharacterized protein n=1 Tax=Triticum urartu TaxID=4572 RepID=M7ZHI0_TRIUA|nr:hypothetical protein TRIUR3_15843 [Triticum urartu]